MSLLYTLSDFQEFLDRYVDDINGGEFPEMLKMNLAMLENYFYLLNEDGYPIDRLASFDGVPIKIRSRLLDGQIEVDGLIFWMKEWLQGETISLWHPRDLEKLQERAYNFVMVN